jgi:sorting nexin-3/12
MADTTVDATRRLNVKKQTLDDAYAAPANFLEIDVINPITHGVGKKRYTDYEVRMRVSNIYFASHISATFNVSHI